MRRIVCFYWGWRMHVDNDFMYEARQTLTNTIKYFPEQKYNQLAKPIRQSANLNTITSQPLTAAHNSYTVISHNEYKTLFGRRLSKH